MHTVLFLDFDGVTHPEGRNRQDLPFSQLHLIEDVLREFPSLEIVISSSWRDTYTIEGLRDLFAEDIAPRLVGVTPSVNSPQGDWLPGIPPAHEREWEIEAWLKANRQLGNPWLAIDDRPQWFRPDCPHLLVTESSKGFQSHQADRLREMLQERGAT